MQVLRTLALGVAAGILTASAQTAPRPATSRAKTTPARTTKKSQRAPAKETVAGDPSRPFPLESVNVTGNKQLSDAEIVKMTGLQAGQQVSKKDFDAAQQHLLDSGLFETVAYRYAPLPKGQAFSATFEVKEIAQLFPYRFEALDLPEPEIRAWLRQQEPLFGDRIPPTAPVIKRFSEAIEKFAASKEKPTAIIGKLQPDNKGQLEMVFQPSSLPAVAQVTFSGTRAISNPTLQQAITGAGIGAIYTEPRFRQILDASIRPLYEAQGYMRVAFPKIETKPVSDVKGIALNVHVQEGPVYKLHEVNITGEMAENARLAKEGNFRINEIIDMNAVNEGAKRVEKYLKRRGYLNASANVERKIDDKAKQVDISLNVDPGPQYRMGKLDIVGLDINTEPAIRKMWALAEKAPFDFEYPDIFLGEMPNVLDNVGRTRSTVKPDPGTLTVDVLLTFSPPEGKPGDPTRRRPGGRTRTGSVEIP